MTVRGEGAGVAELEPERGRILAQAQSLSFPRYPGTEGDRKAIALVGEAMRAANLEVAEESFSYDLRPAWRALRTVLVGCGLCLGAAGWIAHGSPWVALGLEAVAVLAIGVFLGWAPGLEKIYRHEGPTVTANVMGRRRGQRSRMTLIFMAHHDSKSQNLTLPWRLGLTILALLGGVLLPLPLLVSILGAESSPWQGWVSVLCGTCAALALFVLSTLRNGNRSPGGIDNAGSLGIVLELARTLPGQMPEDVDLIFLSPGAEEDHMVGAMRWLDRHLAELEDRPLYTLNFDGAGNPGRLVVMDRYGFGGAFSPFLSRIAQHAARALGLRLWRIVTPPGMGIDTIPFVHRGVESITFSSGSLGRGTLGVHSPNDLPEHLDGPTLERVARLATAVALELAQGGEQSV